jgi:hypothetical protein
LRSARQMPAKSAPRLIRPRQSTTSPHPRAPAPPRAPQPKKIQRPTWPPTAESSVACSELVALLQEEDRPSFARTGAPRSKCRGRGTPDAGVRRRSTVDGSAKVEVPRRSLQSAGAPQKPSDFLARRSREVPLRSLQRLGTSCVPPTRKCRGFEGSPEFVRSLLCTSHFSNAYPVEHIVGALCAFVSRHCALNAHARSSQGCAAFNAQVRVAARSCRCQR